MSDVTETAGREIVGNETLRRTGGAVGWMVGIGTVAYFLPFFSALLGGFTGGYRAGRLRWALIACIPSSLMLGGFTWAFRRSMAVPLWQLGTLWHVPLLFLGNTVCLFLGAYLGATVLRESRRSSVGFWDPWPLRT